MAGEVKGHISPGFEPVKQHLQKMLDTGCEDKLQLCVYVGKECVVDLYGTTFPDSNYSPDTMQVRVYLVYDKTNLSSMKPNSIGDIIVNSFLVYFCSTSGRFWRFLGFKFSFPVFGSIWFMFRSHSDSVYQFKFILALFCPFLLVLYQLILHVIITHFGSFWFIFDSF